MSPGLLWSLAWRNLHRNLRRSLLAGSAMTLGLLCLIVFQALKVGLHEEMVHSVTRLDAGTLQILPAGYRPGLTSLLPLPHPERPLRELARVPGVRFAPRLRAPALALAGSGSAAVLLSGIEPERERRLTLISGQLLQGDYLDRDGVLIGAELAESLGLQLGDPLKLLARSLFGQPVSRSLPVVGIYRTALASFDRNHLFVPLATAQQLLQAEGVVSEIAVAAPEGRESALARELRRALPGDAYRIAGWQELAPDVAQLIELNDATLALLAVIVFAIVALGIANALAMSVFERVREFGILAALGTRPAAIVTLVLRESLLLGVAAALVGSLLGWGACLYFGRYGFDLTELTSANNYFATSHVLHARLLPADLLLANLLTLLTALAAGSYPAVKAARLNPVEALRQL